MISNGTAHIAFKKTTILAIPRPMCTYRRKKLLCFPLFLKHHSYKKFKQKYQLEFFTYFCFKNLTNLYIKYLFQGPMFLSPVWVSCLIKTKVIQFVVLLIFKFKLLKVFLNVRTIALWRRLISINSMVKSVLKMKKNWMRYVIKNFVFCILQGDGRSLFVNSKTQFCTVKIIFINFEWFVRSELFQLLKCYFLF